MWFNRVLVQPFCVSCLINRSIKTSDVENLMLCSKRVITAYSFCRSFFTRSIVFSEDKIDIVPKDFFEKLGTKTKDTYLDMVRIYESRSPQRRGHVEFIYAALRHMEEFGVHKDLEAYKSLINIFPKGKFIPTNLFQAEFMHYPKQQQCAIDVLQKMEDNGVMPDPELEQILVNIFGKTGHPVRKYWRMMYWMPKFNNINPWPLPKPLPNDSLELAVLALKQMSSVDLQSVVEVFQTKAVEHSNEDTWLVSAHSPVQAELIENHSEKSPMFVEGAFRVWLRDKSVNYFILRSDPVSKPQEEIPDYDDVSGLKTPFDEPITESSIQLMPSVHEQEEGTILGMCASGTSSRSSLLSWIRILQKNNPRLVTIPILFSLRSPIGEIIPINQEVGDKDSSDRKISSCEKSEMCDKDKV
ncbi:evolutionarily conserved signaling intermediate in Toll pathway, mitochondrial [Ischnura elegans]|uniref:evolutionarily conserved signaling intermediate in Toll pathway, mitochondrial n=1 Tax=Ischnura elegans TaxID=197161 RepID=UPI001ED884A6|nr:evolutionarily conserved signaling intermediate in Toll pathway, mitochondrial [Ischnura elegans]